jgi:hypothetical protein
MTVAEGLTAVQSLQLDTLPEHTHIQLRLFLNKKESHRKSGLGISIDIYILGEQPDNDMVAVSAEAEYDQISPGEKVFVLSQAWLQNLLKVGKNVTFEQYRPGVDSMYDRKLYVSNISCRMPDNLPRHVNSFSSFEAGTLISLRGASNELAI